MLQDFETLYNVLEVSESASQAEIKAAFLRLAREYHPDRVPEHLTKIREDAEEKFKCINDAYGALCSPERRKQYDDQLGNLRGWKSREKKAVSPPLNATAPSASATEPLPPFPPVAIAGRRPRPQPLCSLWDVLLLVVVFVVIDFIVSVATVSYRVHAFHERMDKLATDTAILLPGEGIAYAFTFLMMYLLITRSLQEPFWSGVRWVWPSRAATVLGLVALGTPLALTIGFLESILPMPSHVPFEKLFTSAAAAYGIGIFAVTVAPLMEELFFRGFLYPALRRYGMMVGVGGTALAFALLHGAQYGWGWSVALMFIVGVVLTSARAWTGSVAPGFLIHVGYNLTLFVSLFVGTDHFRHLERLSQ